ncbi:MAG: GNAT family N-acetyltransferase [Chloroflexi bacterium]|nr:GNAT family N-acetyltransferase [Chloroflexota bacterium]
MIEVAVGDLGRHEQRFAAGVLGRAFRDNPVVIAVQGDNPLRRMRSAERVFGSFVSLLEQPPLAARRAEWIVGICGMAPPGTCQPPLLKQMRFLPAVLRDGPLATLRTLRVMSEWKKRDPEDRHWHLGPVGVEPGLQGMAVGSQMMERFCARMDAEGELAYLETDKPENVRFYERFGFVTTEEAEVLRVPNWFMLREPRQ